MRTRVVVCAVLLALAAAAPAGMAAAGVAAAGVPAASAARAGAAGAGVAGAGKHHPRHRCRVHRRCAHPSRAAHRPRPRKPAKSTSVPAPVRAPTPPPLPAPAPAPAPARVQVSAREFSLTLSRPQVTAGQAVIEFVDAGQDPHDLHIRPASGGDDVAAFALGLPGTHADQAITLAPGTYTLYCSLPGHEALGMHATLTVG